MKLKLFQRLESIGYKKDYGHVVSLDPRIEIGNNYLKVVRGGSVNLANLCGGPRLAQTYLTSKSRRAMLARVDEISNVFKPQYMLTLTYPKEFPLDGKKVKQDLKELYYYIRGNNNFSAKDSNIIFFWKMEFQHRGAPHFHILVQTDLDYMDLVKLCLKKWMSLTHNDQKVCVDVGKIREDFAAKIYCSVHFSKDSQNTKPDNFERPGRYWGILGYDRIEKMASEWKVAHNKLEIVDGNIHYV